ncbi:M13 family metallopeptidase [Pseudofulvibacter geojedonensis]|uniref:M13 family metallopeptidase n=1 Tax=Pseudofulvibacter geojedonensis TaxID=1123758 RepID=A0ABW3I1F6_9FLAO
MNLIKKSVLLTLAASTVAVSCKQEKKATEETAQEVAVKVEEKVPGINLDYMDASIAPNHDFYNHVNGKWMAATEIPSDRTRWGSFDELRKMTDDDMLSILKKAMNDENLDLSSDQGKAVLLYKSIMDLEARNKAGVTPIQKELAMIDAIKNAEDLQAFITKMEPNGGAGLYGVYIGADSKDSNKNVVNFGAGSLGLPDRDYYVKDDADSKEKREKYVAHITRMLQFLGDSEEQAAAQAKQILAFETKLATPRLDKVERRDARKRYNPRSVADLSKMVPSIDWKKYLSGIGLEKVDTLIVGQLKYTESLENILKENDVDAWKAYLRWSTLNGAASSLSSEIEKANWDFYSKELRGAKEQRPLEERALARVNRSLGEALGQLYVSEKFPPEAKEKAQKMISNVLKAFGNRISVLPWMSKETKQKAIEKLEATTVKVAYPDKWKDYSELEVKEGNSYYDNRMAAIKWGFNQNIEKLGKPVDKSEWYMAPQVVNAYFNPSYNEIVFPAAILQPPFYNYTADEAVNYGGIGAVIGHEISHSFDDSGARFDKDGNLNNWWTDEDLKQFEALGQALADQYSAIEVLPETNINGEFTLGENIGDLGGVNAAYDGLQMYFEQEGRPENIDGFTPEQRFFMSWATVWRSKYRDEALKNQIKTDPHSPGMVRATQPLLNVDAFYKAFNIKEGDAMYIKPEDRVKIW